MQTFSITLGSIADVKVFVDVSSRYSCEIDVLSGRYVIDAKSIMGLFSLDLQKPLRVDFYGSDEESASFCQDIAPFVSPEN